MGKILSYKINHGTVEITGDSRKMLLPSGDKQFIIYDTERIVMDTPEDRIAFFIKLLQENHVYTFDGANQITIDNNVFEIVDQNVLRSVKTDEEFIVPTRDKRNLFRVYQDFIIFLHYEDIQIKMIDKLNKLFLDFKINKKTSEIKKTGREVLIYVNSLEYEDQHYPDFLLQLIGNKLEFMHFFESEGEYYSNGEKPMHREDIIYEIKRQSRLLEKFDKLSQLFNITL